MMTTTTTDDHHHGFKSDPEDDAPEWFKHNAKTTLHRMDNIIGSISNHTTSSMTVPRKTDGLSNDAIAVRETTRLVPRARQRNPQ